MGQANTTDRIAALEEENRLLKARLTILEETAREHERERDDFEREYALLRELLDSSPDPVFLEDRDDG